MTNYRWYYKYFFIYWAMEQCLCSFSQWSRFMLTTVYKLSSRPCHMDRNITLQKDFSYPQLSSLPRSNEKRERVFPLFLSCQKPGQEEKQELDRWQEGAGGGEGGFLLRMGADEGGKLSSHFQGLKTESHYKSCLVSLGRRNIVRLQKITHPANLSRTVSKKMEAHSFYIRSLWKSVIRETRESGPCWLLKLRLMSPLAGLLASSCRYKRFFSFLGWLSRPSTKYFFPHRTLFQFNYPHHPAS